MTLVSQLQSPLHLPGAAKNLSASAGPTLSSTMCAAQSTDYAATIRRTFQYEGLQGAVEALPLEKRFKLNSVKDVRP